VLHYTPRKSTVFPRAACPSALSRYTGRQGSALLTSMSAADCFIVLPAAWGRIAADTVVEVQPFYGLI